MTFQIDENIINILGKLISDDKLVKIYKSAFYILDDDNIQDRFALAAHELREIINIISREMSNIIQKERLDNSKRENILELLQKEEINGDSNIGELLSHEIWRIAKIVKIIDKNLQTLDYKLRAFFGLHKINIPNQRLLKNIKDAHERFNSISHHSGGIVNESDFKRLIAIFNYCILTIGRSKTQGLLEIDKILKIQKPTEENLRNIFAIMIFPEQEQHFFENLESPEWFIPLKNAGFFNNPPDKEEKDGWISYPLWPQSIYLKKIYKSYNNEVVEIIKNSSKTNNVSIIRIFLEILVDIDISSQERKKLLARWFVNSRNFLIAFPLVDHLNMLIDKDDPAIFDIFKMMLSFEIDEKNNYDLFDHPIEPYLYSGAYEHLLMISVPKLFNKYPEKILKILCELLNLILKYETIMNISGSESDQSLLWRRTIENHVQNPGTKYLKGELIEVIGESLKALVNNDPRTFLDLYQSLKSYNFSIFIRLRMYLLLHYQSSELDDEILSFLLESRYLNHSFYWHEYYLLLQQHLVRFTEKNQNRIIDFILKNTEHEYDKFKLLHCIQTFLKAKQRDEYIQLSKKYPEPEHPEFNIYISSFIGPVSPVEKKDLSTMSIEELIVYLKSWEPISGFHQPSRIGLARELEQLISNDPIKYIDVFKNPSELFHTYLLHLLSGLRKAIESGLYNNIPEVIIISRKILDLPPKSELIIKKDRWESCDWSDILLEISDLLFSSIKKDAGVFKKNEYDNILQIASELLNNELPIENRYLNYMTMEAGNIRYPHSFKTVSFDTLIEVAFKYKNANEDISIFLNTFSKLIQDQFQLRYFARVFGRYFHSLIALDEGWALSIKTEILPITYDEIWEEAWKGYILHNDRIFTITHNLLIEDYLNAINYLDDAEQWASFEAGHLRYHVALWYLVGDEDLSKDSLVTIFFKKAKIELRESFIQYIGECVRDNYRDLHDTMDRSVIDNRCIQFWEWRLNHFKKNIADGNKPQLDELENFDTLFTFFPTEDSTILTKMKDTVELTEGKLSLVYYEDFFKKLIAYSDKHITDVLNIVWKVFDKMDELLFHVKKDSMLLFFSSIKKMLKTKDDIMLNNKIVDLLVSKKQFHFKQFFISTEE